MASRLPMHVSVRQRICPWSTLTVRLRYVLDHYMETVQLISSTTVKSQEAQGGLIEGQFDH